MFAEHRQLFATMTSNPKGFLSAATDYVEFHSSPESWATERTKSGTDGDYELYLRFWRSQPNRALPRGHKKAIDVVLEKYIVAQYFSPDRELATPKALRYKSLNTCLINGKNESQVFVDNIKACNACLPHKEFQRTLDEILEFSTQVIDGLGALHSY